MSPKHRGYCMQMREDQKVPDSVQCCNSCHVDNEEYGYSLCSWQTDDGKIEYDVCCTLSNWKPEHEPKV